jgi:hypothetical protein
MATVDDPIVSTSKLGLLVMTVVDTVGHVEISSSSNPLEDMISDK